MHAPAPQIRTAGDSAILLRFPDTGPEPMRAAAQRLLALRTITAVLNVHPAYDSVLISFDPRRATHQEIEMLAREALTRGSDLPLARTWELPVRYTGPDLNDVATHHGMDPEEIVRVHSNATYVVEFLGFAPGFAYLSGLPPRLATPRLAVPRRRVPAGSVGIAGGQTGVYPIASPGGWRIIGFTETILYNPESAEPVLLNIGDRIRFVAI